MRDGDVAASQLHAASSSDRQEAFQPLREGWESFAMLYGTEVEHLYTRSRGLRIQSSVVPWPEGLTLKVGIRWTL